MKALSLLVTLLMSVSALAGHGDRTLTIHNFTEAMSKKHGKWVPKNLRNLEVQDLVMSGPHISFKLKNFPIHIELVKTKKVAMKVNGVAFAPEDFKSRKILKKQIVKKFKIAPRKFSLLSLFVPQAHAVFIQGDVPAGIANNLMNSGYNVQVGGNFNQQRTYPSVGAMVAALNGANAQLPGLMSAFMGAANNMTYTGYQFPTIEPFKLKSESST